MALLGVFVDGQPTPRVGAGAVSTRPGAVVRVAPSRQRPLSATLQVREGGAGELGPTRSRCDTGRRRAAGHRACSREGALACGCGGGTPRRPREGRDDDHGPAGLILLAGDDSIVTTDVAGSAGPQTAEYFEGIWRGADTILVGHEL